MSAPIHNASDAMAYLLAGRAIVTLKSRATGQHYTYKIKRTSNRHDRWMVFLLTPGDSYVYLGLIDGNPRRLRLTQRSGHSSESRAVLALHFAIVKMTTENQIPPALEVWHEGQCGRCGRPLTRPDSIERGLGPKCAGITGVSDED